MRSGSSCPGHEGFTPRCKGVKTQRNLGSKTITSAVGPGRAGRLGVRSRQHACDPLKRFGAPAFQNTLSFLSCDTFENLLAGGMHPQIQRERLLLQQPARQNLAVAASRSSRRCSSRCSAEAMIATTDEHWRRPRRRRSALTAGLPTPPLRFHCGSHAGWSPRSSVEFPAAVIASHDGWSHRAR